MTKRTSDKVVRLVTGLTAPANKAEDAITILAHWHVFSMKDCVGKHTAHAPAFVRESSFKIVEILSSARNSYKIFCPVSLFFIMVSSTMVGLLRSVSYPCFLWLMLRPMPMLRLCQRVIQFRLQARSVLQGGSGTLRSTLEDLVRTPRGRLRPMLLKCFQTIFLLVCWKKKRG